MFNKKRFIEFEHSVDGGDAVILEDMMKDFDVKYEKHSISYGYYRLKATKKDVKKIKKNLIENGFNAVFVDNRLFHVYERNQ